MEKERVKAVVEKRNKVAMTSKIVDAGIASRREASAKTTRPSSVSHIDPIPRERLSISPRNDLVCSSARSFFP
ncbi:hypothetical protein OROMI_012930 [Orobanche minor]